MLRIAVPFLAIFILAGRQPAASGHDGSSPDLSLDRVFARFNAAAPPAYRAYRHLEAGNRDSSKHATMEVWTEHRPGAGFRFEVVREEGSEYVRNHVLRAVLKAEQELIDTGKPLRAPLESRNYAFEFGGRTEQGLTLLLLRPARKAHGIVRGSALVAPETGAVVRMEGRLTKSPSFWVRDVDVVWQFTRIGDAIVPTELRSSGRVIFYGRQPFRMTYDYQSVEGRPVHRGARLPARE